VRGGQGATQSSRRLRTTCGIVPYTQLFPGPSQQLLVSRPDWLDSAPSWAADSAAQLLLVFSEQLLQVGEGASLGDEQSRGAGLPSTLLEMICE
jgi:hypothetical protein